MMHTWAFSDWLIGNYLFKPCNKTFNKTFMGIILKFSFLHHQGVYDKIEKLRWTFLTTPELGPVSVCNYGDNSVWFILCD